MYPKPPTKPVDSAEKAYGIITVSLLSVISSYKEAFKVVLKVSVVSSIGLSIEFNFFISLL
jgi:hypothetical protein